MKKIGIIILLVFSFLLLTNCNKSKNEEEKNEKISFSDENYKLFEKFGVDTGAVGFAILTDGLKGYYKDTDKKDFEVLIAYDDSNFEKLVEIVNDFQKKGLRVRTENIENLGESDFEIFNFDEKYIFQNGELKKEE